MCFSFTVISELHIVNSHHRSGVLLSTGRPFTLQVGCLDIDRSPLHITGRVSCYRPVAHPYHRTGVLLSTGCPFTSQVWCLAIDRSPFHITGRVSCFRPVAPSHHRSGVLPSPCLIFTLQVGYPAIDRFTQTTFPGTKAGVKVTPVFSASDFL